MADEDVRDGTSNTILIGEDGQIPERGPDTRRPDTAPVEDTAPAEDVEIPLDQLPERELPKEGGSPAADVEEVLERELDDADEPLPEHGRDAGVGVDSESPPTAGEPPAPPDEDADEGPLVEPSPEDEVTLEPPANEPRADEAGPELPAPESPAYEAPEAEVDLPELHEPPPRFASGYDGGRHATPADTEEPSTAPVDDTGVDVPEVPPAESGPETDDQPDEPIEVNADDGGGDAGLLEQVADAVGDLWDDAQDVVT